MPSPRVLILGGGLAGLACAHHLLSSRPDLDLRVLEAAPRAGGNLGTATQQGYRVELGPNGFLDSKPGLIELCRSLGIDNELVAASEGSRKNRYVYHAGEVRKLPGGVFDFLTTPLLSLRGKLELLGEPLRKRRKSGGEESVASFARRRFGNEAAAVFVQSLVTGIHAADWEHLSVQAAFPRLAEFERDFGSVVRGFLAAGREKKRLRPPGAPRAVTRMWSFPAGLQRLVDALTERIGPALELHCPVTDLTRDGTEWKVTAGRDEFRADAVVLALPAPRAAKLAGLTAELRRDFADITYSPVNVVALGYREADCPFRPEGFGVIAPPTEGRAVLGVQWCSEIFPGRAPPGHVLWRALVGGATRPELAALPDAEITRVVADEMRAMMRVRGEPAFAQVVRWPHAIPHYTLGQVGRERRLRAGLARLPNLELVGTSVGGVAMNDGATGAKLAAERLAARL